MVSVTANGRTGPRRARRLGYTVASVMAVLLARRTRLRRAETERARRERAEAALLDTRRRTDDLLATLSHELRTPLSAILGWARLLRSTQSDHETVERALESIERNVRMQIRVLDELLDVSRILSGRLRLDVRPLELTPLLVGAIEGIGPEARAKAVRLQSALDPRAGWVAGDPERLPQVLWHLLANAVRSTPAGGSVEVCLERRDPAVEIRVTDGGPGIPPELLPHVFELSRPPTGAAARLGLGLALARQLTELHGGAIRADSPGVGRGTTFTVSLPVPAAG